MSVIPHMDIMVASVASVVSVASEGRLKLPAIDFYHENPSIGGDFNRPSDVKINAQIPFLSICEITVSTKKKVRNLLYINFAELLFRQKKSA